MHYHKETLSFEVIDFVGPYHAIFRSPCYTKFVAVRSYTYLNLKMLGLRRVITITSSFRDVYECEREAIEQANHALSPKARLDVEIMWRMSSGTTRCPLSSTEHQTMLIMPTGISPTLLLSAHR